ncbi:MAG: response regulator transcription factor [Candidatus Thiothrix moscowensis]|nr:response regulator transcription factor [Candidatus Thiothrix moscowensis]
MRVLILDDHPLFADAMRQVLLRLGNNIHIHAADNAIHALRFVDEGNEYDLILVDINLPGLDGFSFMRLLRERLVVSPVIIISASQNTQKITLAMQQGAMGYIHKSSNAKTILNSIQHVLSGRPCFPTVEPAPRATAIEPTQLGISGRQLDVLKLMEKGVSNKVIAYELHITESTVKNHISKLFEALATHNRFNCVMEARRLGLLPSRTDIEQN